MNCKVLASSFAEELLLFETLTRVPLAVPLAVPLNRDWNNGVALAALVVVVEAASVLVSEDVVEVSNSEEEEVVVVFFFFNIGEASVNEAQATNAERAT